MKKSIFSKVAAAVVAGAMVLGMTVTAFAGNADSMLDDKNVVVVYGVDETTEEANGWLNMNGYKITDVYGLTYYVTYDQAELDDSEKWIGGGVGWNSDSTGWASTEWGKASGEKPVSIEDTLDGTSGTITIKSDTPVFAEDDTWAQAWIQTWGGTVTVTGIDLLGSDGKPLSASGSDAPADDTPSGDSAATTAVIFAAVAALAVAATVSVKKYAVER